MSTESHGRPEGWDAPVPDDSGGWHDTGRIGGGAEEVEDVDLTEDVTAGTDAERLRADDVDQPADLAHGVVGDDPALTDAERLRADDIAEPPGLAEGVVGDSPALTDAERIRADDIVEPGGVEETGVYDEGDRLDFEERRGVDQPGDYDRPAD